MIDYFEHYEQLPEQVKNLIDKHQDCEGDYNLCNAFIADLNAIGWTADYDLSGSLSALRPTNSRYHDAGAPVTLLLPNGDAVYCKNINRGFGALINLYSRTPFHGNLDAFLDQVTVWVHQENAYNNSLELKMSGTGFILCFYEGAKGHAIKAYCEGFIFGRFAEFLGSSCFRAYSLWFTNDNPRPTSGEDAEMRGMTSTQIYYLWWRKTMAQHIAGYKE